MTPPTSRRPHPRELQAVGTIAILAIGLVAGAALPALAHLGAPEGRGLFLDDDGELIGAGTTWGVLERTAEGYVRTCEEAVGDTVHFYHWAKDREEVVVGTNTGVLSSPDMGCSWNPSGLENKFVTIMRTPRDQPGVLFVSTSTTGEDNGIFRSLDDGETWAATSLSRPDFAFTSLQVSDDGQLVVASGIDYAETIPRLFMSTDGGATFEEQTPFPGESDISFINCVGISPDGIALSTLRTGAQGSTLYVASLDLTDLGTGIAFDTDEANGVVTDYARFDDTEYVLVNRSLMHKRALGEAEFTFDDAGPGRCLLLPRESDRLWGCAQPFQLGHFLSVGDAEETWEPSIGHLDVAERMCPVGTVGEERCRYLFEPGPDVTPEQDAGPQEPSTPEPTTGAPDPEPTPDVTPGPCGCDATSNEGVSMGIFGMMGLALALRRRRQSIAHD